MAVLVRAGRAARCAAGRGRLGSVLAAQVVERVAVNVLSDDTESGVGDVWESILERVPPDVLYNMISGES